jgi:hypothetical protein
MPFLGTSAAAIPVNLLSQAGIQRWREVRMLEL